MTPRKESKPRRGHAILIALSLLRWDRPVFVPRQFGIGSPPTTVPTQQSIEFDLAVNLKIAKALGLDIPPTLLALADRVIE